LIQALRPWNILAVKSVQRGFPNKTMLRKDAAEMQAKKKLEEEKGRMDLRATSGGEPVVEKGGWHTEVGDSGRGEKKLHSEGPVGPE